MSPGDFVFTVTQRESIKSIDRMKLLSKQDISVFLIVCDALRRGGRELDLFKKGFYYSKPIETEDILCSIKHIADFPMPAGCINETESCINRFRNITIEDYRLLHSAVGMVTEAIEYLHAVTSYMQFGGDIDMVNLVEEIGDVAWYSGLGVDAIGITFEQVFYINDAKLAKRYGSVFTTERAENRDLDGERDTLDRLVVPGLNADNIELAS